MTLNTKAQYHYLSHPVFPDGKIYYCRAANAILDVSVMFCDSCPMLRGFTQGAYQGFPECYYYDENVDDLSPKGLQKRIAREILLGRTGEFPSFAYEENPLTRILEPALQFAAKAHKGAFRKGSKIPYIVHPMEAAMIVAEITQDPAVITAAALHDVLEDTPYLPQDIEEQFGREVLELVLQESEDKREDIPAAQSWRIRKEESLSALSCASCEARVVALGDKLSNMRQMKRDYDKIGDKLWGKFNQKDKIQHAWYYQTIGEILASSPVLEKTNALQEYHKLVADVFGENSI